MAELNLLGLFVIFVKREVRDPAKAENTRLQEAEIFSKADPRSAGECRGALGFVTGEKYGITVTYAG